MTGRAGGSDGAVKEAFAGGKGGPDGENVE